MKRLILSAVVLAVALLVSVELVAARGRQAPSVDGVPSLAAVPDPEPVRIDRTEVVAIEPFNVAQPDGSERTFDRRLLIHGAGFFGTAHGPLVHFDGSPAFGIEIHDERLVTVYLASDQRGSCQVRLTLSDRQEASCTAVL